MMSDSPLLTHGIGRSPPPLDGNGVSDRSSRPDLCIPPMAPAPLPPRRPPLLVPCFVDSLLTLRVAKPVVCAPVEDCAAFDQLPPEPCPPPSTDGEDAVNFVPEDVVGASWTVFRLSPRLLPHYDSRISLDELSPFSAIASPASLRVPPVWKRRSVGGVARLST